MVKISMEIHESVKIAMWILAVTVNYLNHPNCENWVQGLKAQGISNSFRDISQENSSLIFDLHSLLLLTYYGPEQQ